MFAIFVCSLVGTLGAEILATELTVEPFNASFLAKFAVVVCSLVGTMRTYVPATEQAVEPFTALVLLALSSCLKSQVYSVAL